VYKFKFTVGKLMYLNILLVIDSFSRSIHHSCCHGSSALSYGVSYS
jgi:hypothetical protein